MPNPWDNDPVVGQSMAPWESDVVISERPANQRVGKSGRTFEQAQAHRAELERELEEKTKGIRQRQQLGRDLTLGARATWQGLAAIPDLIAAPAANLINRVLPEKYHQGTFSDLADFAMDKITGQQIRPETPKERIASDITAGVSGAATGVGLGNLLSRAAGPVVSGVGRSMTARPLAQIFGGATGGAAAGAARESGAGPAGQIAAGLAGALAPGVMASRASLGTMAGRQPAIAEADRLRVNLTGEPGDQAMQLGQAARRAQPEVRGEAMTDIQAGLRGQREAARQVAGQRFEDVRGMDARVLQPEAKRFIDSAAQSLVDEGFDLAEMPKLSSRIGQLQTLLATPGTREVKLNALQQWRQRLTKMSPADASEREAVRRLRNQYDEFILRQADQDLMTGDPAAAKAWRDATNGWAEFKGKFDADKTIANIVRGDSQGSPATAETMRNWVFGQSASGAKPHAGAVVKRMNQILGADSPQMDALRKEVVFDLLRPLLDDPPNLKAFLARNENYFVNSPTLKKELFPAGIEELDSIVGLAKGISKRPGSTMPPEIHPSNTQFFGTVQRMILAALTGHQLGKASAQMTLGRQVMSRAEHALMLDKLRSSTVGKAAKEDILRQWLGYDPGQKMFPGALTLQQAAQAQNISGAENNEEP